MRTKRGPSQLQQRAALLLFVQASRPHRPDNRLAYLASLIEGAEQMALYVPPGWTRQSWGNVIREVKALADGCQQAVEMLNL